SWNLLGKGYEKIPLLASANGRGDYHRKCPVFPSAKKQTNKADGIVKKGHGQNVSQRAVDGMNT
ncbi:hypothetical protein ABQ013_17120, partial [Xanthomonas citri pv. malvacearum]|uniref:hypothetical protein n=1 Tax=Xanthomonas citri TaxID=346 RepID=UPI001E56C9E3